MEDKPALPVVAGSQMIRWYLVLPPHQIAPSQMAPIRSQTILTPRSQNIRISRRMVPGRIILVLHLRIGQTCSASVNYTDKISASYYESTCYTQASDTHLRLKPGA
jgi:hypothetical protein